MRLLLEFYPHRTPTLIAMQRYWELLRDLSDEAFQAGVNGALRKTKKLPAIADIIREATAWITDHEHIPGKDEVVTNIDLILSEDYSYFYNDRQYWTRIDEEDEWEPRYIHPLVARTVAILGGLDTIKDGMADQNDGQSDSRRQYWRFRIHEAYEAEKERWITARMKEGTTYEDISPDRRPAQPTARSQESEAAGG